MICKKKDIPKIFNRNSNYSAIFVEVDGKVKLLLVSSSPSISVLLYLS